jgi:hypothetical protein
MTNAPISELEHSAWSISSFTGRGPGGRIVDTPTRLVIETPVERPPYKRYEVERTVLHSTPMARSLYQRMGYEDVATFEIWAAPDSVHL